MQQHTITIVDDHTLFSNSLKSLIESYLDYKVVAQLKNGKQLIDYYAESKTHPDIVLLDIKMPVMNGIETMTWLKEHQPHQKVLVLSMEDNDDTIITMLRNGAKGYILKDIDPQVFKKALDEVIHRGFYYSEKITTTLLHEVITPSDKGNRFGLNDREYNFIQLACSEMTYKEIAAKMFLSPKTIDGYREALFKKLQVKSRIGLAMFAIKNEIVKL